MDNYGEVHNLRVIPVPLTKALIEVEVTPRRRNPANVIKRGSSQPSTQFSVTRHFNCNRQGMLKLMHEKKNLITV